MAETISISVDVFVTHGLCRKPSRLRKRTTWPLGSNGDETDRCKHQWNIGLFEFVPMWSLVSHAMRSVSNPFRNILLHIPHIRDSSSTPVSSKQGVSTERVCSPNILGLFGVYFLGSQAKLTDPGQSSPALAICVWRIEAKDGEKYGTCKSAIFVAVAVAAETHVAGTLFTNYPRTWAC